jgi:hypothetical protein
MTRDFTGVQQALDWCFEEPFWDTRGTLGG